MDGDTWRFTLRQSLLYPEFSAVVRGSCGLLDDVVDFNKPDLGLNKLQSQTQSKTHTPEGRVAVWLFVKSGQQWEGYCNWRRTSPEPAPWPTPTAWPTVPLTVCLGWDDFSDVAGGTGITSPNQQVRVKLLQEGQAGWLECTYPEHLPDGRPGTRHTYSVPGSPG